LIKAFDGRITPNRTSLSQETYEREIAVYRLVVGESTRFVIICPTLVGSESERSSLSYSDLGE
jgi:hypothetical protein